MSETWAARWAASWASGAQQAERFNMTHVPAGSGDRRPVRHQRRRQRGQGRNQDRAQGCG